MSAEGKRKRVAVIDDSEIVLELVEDALAQAGFDVIATSEPKQPNLAGERPVALVIADVNMPEVLGDDLPTFLKEAWGISAPTLLFSDIPEHELARRARAAGADGYICKSWGIDELVRRVQAILADV